MRDTRNKSLASAALINECALTYRLTDGNVLRAFLKIIASSKKLKRDMRLEKWYLNENC
jgi:hypothetical protein